MCFSEIELKGWFVRRSVTSLNCTLKMIENSTFYVMYLLPQFCIGYIDYLSIALSFFFFFTLTI